MYAVMRRLLVVMVAIPLVSCVGTPSYMKTTAALSTPDATSAVVRFLRPLDFKFAAARTWAVLDGEKAIGNLSHGMQFDFVTTPGKHLFLFPGGWPAQPYFLEADLLPGKRDACRARTTTRDVRARPPTRPWG